MNLNIIQEITQHIALSPISHATQTEEFWGGVYSKNNILFTLPAMVIGEIITQESLDNPFKVDITIIHDILVDGIFCTCGCECIFISVHFGIKTLELFGTLILEGRDDGLLCELRQR